MSNTQTYADDIIIKMREKITFFNLAQEMMLERYKYNDEITEYILFINKIVAELSVIQNKVLENNHQGHKGMEDHLQKVVKNYECMIVGLQQSYQVVRHAYDNTNKHLDFFVTPNREKKHVFTRAERLVALFEYMEAGEYTKEMIAGLIGVKKEYLSKYLKKIEHLKGELYDTKRTTIIIL